MKSFYKITICLLGFLMMGGSALAGKQKASKCKQALSNVSSSVPAEKKPASTENPALLELRAYAEKLSSQRENLIPLENFFKNPETVNIQISPSGQYLAYLKPYKKRKNIYVRKRDGSEPEKRITSRTSRDVASFFWKENDTLLFKADSEGDENYHIFRTSVKGETEKDLTPFKNTRNYVIDSLKYIDEDHILVVSNKRDKKILDAYRLNISTGEMKMIAKNPGFFDIWFTDHDGKLRLVTAREGLQNSIYYRETEEEEFKKVLSYDFKTEVFPKIFTFDNKNIYVSSNLNQDKKSVQIFDPRRKKILSTVFSHPEVDVSSLSYSRKRRKLLTAHYITWKTKAHFFDKEFQEIIQDIKLKIPGKRIDIVSTNRGEDIFIVQASSDRNPGVYYVYYVKEKKLEKMVESAPWLKEEKMAEMKPIKYTSRDGLLIHAYLTLPKGSSGKNLPLVVNPHGGPRTRNSWYYDSKVQFFASRGYAVFQPNFRGSTGYGKKFLNAGNKQWGRAMQDDITDGVKYLIDQGIADKNKVAIYGGSYGGYAVLAGLAFNPNLYACGVNVVGISNLFTRMSSFPPHWEIYRKQYYERVGHPEKDKELLKKVSPLFHVDKIKAPLFVVHGANDSRVNKAESDQIVQALERQGVSVPYLVKYDEGHGFRNEENKIEFYRLMSAFLHKHLN